MGKRKSLDWPKVLDEYDAGNLSVEEFCKQKGIHPNTFYRHKKNFRDKVTALVRLPLNAAPNPQPQLLLQVREFILKIPEGADPATLETTLRILKDIR